MRNDAEFNTLARTFQDDIFRLALGYLKSRDAADDVTQEVMIALYQSDKVFENDRHAKNWLMKVTVNECRKVWRRPWRFHEDIDDYAESIFQEQKDYSDLFAAIMNLEKKKRITVILYYVEGYSLAEIADLTGTPKATVGTRLARARAELKDLLKEEIS